MDSVSATRSSALREYLKPAGAGAAGAFSEAPPVPAPADGKPVSSAPGFRKVSNEDLPAPGMDQTSVLAMAKQIMEMERYGDFMSARAEENQQMMQEFLGKMRGEIGGAETAMAIPNDPLGPDPVRTSSGGIHPQSQRIKDYIRAHQSEWRKLSYEPPSFEQWQQMRG
jgi:hypothetical protein